MSCEIAKKNFSKSKCSAFPKLIKAIIETEDDFSISAADWADQDDLLTALQAGALDVAADRIYKFPDFSSYEDQSVATVYQATPLNPKRPVMDGKYVFLFGISESMCTHRALYTHRRQGSGRIFLIDVDNQIIGTELSNGDVAGFSIQTLHTENIKLSDGAAVSESPILVALLDSNEFNQNGVITKLDFINEMYRITDVVLTQFGVATATQIVVDVKAECDDEPISGLVAADFVILDDDNGASHAMTSVTESATIPGRYVIVGVAFEASKLNLKSPSAMTTKAYESTGQVVIAAP